MPEPVDEEVPQVVPLVLLGGGEVAGERVVLAVVHDDALQSITHVTRGKDLFHATHLHVLLQALLDLPRPVYHHHDLITDEQGVRLATRDNARTLEAMREAGVTADEIRQRLQAGRVAPETR